MVQEQEKEQLELVMDPKNFDSSSINKRCDTVVLPRFILVYSRDNLPDKTKDGAYVINLDEYSDIGTHWIAL